MAEQPRKDRCTVTVGSEFRAYINDAVSRFSYLHPSVEIEVGADVALVTDGNANVADLVRDFQFTLYRQKIFSETFHLRRTLIEGVMGR